MNLIDIENIASQGGGQVTVMGLSVLITHPRGSYRPHTWNGIESRSRLAAHYGHLLGYPPGNDGDALDVFLGVLPSVPTAYVINQVINDRFDEHKIMLGFGTEDMAATAYRLSFPPGWAGLGSIVELTASQLGFWLQHGPRDRPVAPGNLPHVPRFEDWSLDEAQASPDGRSDAKRSPAALP